MSVQAGWLGVATPEVAEPDDSPTDGDVVSVDGLAAKVILTPGHTEGSLCLYLPEEKLLIAGDTLFAGSVGRTDLPGGNTRHLLDSIRDRLLPLPDATRVIPGHGQSTTIGWERKSNPFLQDL
jgi:hydroxyacylglutathione hydrolase